ncbi:hypothetical protein [Catenulispora rubra]|uniref:hypothetical protein n=1 Tax=Catenulispora rubra TaxID=280293 RepID=UPI0018921C97|nr:hypothetical protein [Catenulispora rubra]
MRCTLTLDNGASIDTVVETDAQAGRLTYRVLTGRLTGTFVITPLALPPGIHLDPSDYTDVRIQFGDGPADADPEHHLGRPVAVPGDVELYGHVELPMQAGTVVEDEEHAGPWRYLRRDADRDVPAGTARAARRVCVAIAADAQAHPDFPAVVTAHLRARAPGQLRIIDHHCARLRERLRSARMELMLWGHYGTAWRSAAGLDAPARTGRTRTVFQSCADVHAALVGCGLIVSEHRRGFAALRVDLPDGSCLLINGRSGTLPRTVDERTGWQVHRYPGGDTDATDPRPFWSAYTSVPDSDTDAMVSAVAAYAGGTRAIGEPDDPGPEPGRRVPGPRRPQD